MRSSKEHAPYSLYKKQTKSGLIWYVRFWDSEAKEYNIVRSTGVQVEGKRERWREADDSAKAILEELRLKPAMQKKDIFLPSEKLVLPKSVSLQAEILAVSDTRNNHSDNISEAGTPFIQYLLDFWSSESEYSKYKRNVRKAPLSASYIQLNHDDVARHIATFPDFQGITLGEVNRKLLKKWQIWMAAKKVTHKRKDGTKVEGNQLSGRRINAILQGMRVAVRWAVDNENLPIDPFKNLDDVTEESKEKGILTLDEMEKLIALPIKDPYARLAVLLAARCGLRRGEVRGIQWGDIKEGIITVQHNYVNADGLKSPKIKGGTFVKNSSPVPLPSDVEVVLMKVKELSEKTADNDFVFKNWKCPDKIISAEYFRCAFARELRSIGIDENTRKIRNLTYHGLRHTYVSLGRMAGLNSFEIQTLARHKSLGMVERYSHGRQAIDFVVMKKRLEDGIKLNTNNDIKTEEASSSLLAIS